MSRYRQRFDCEGWAEPSGKPFKLACCDCGLVHRMVLISEDGKPIGIAAKRDTRATAARRRNFGDKDLHAPDPAIQPTTTMKNPPYFFVFDVESIGLHGEGFAVAGGLYSPDGECRQEFAYHCPSEHAKGENDDRAWVAQHVTIGAESLEYATPKEMRDAFWETWMHMQQYLGAEMFVECGWPVEAAFLEACIKDDEQRNWEGPYPLHEIASFLLAAGLDPMATYARQERELPSHEPLADSRLSARLLFTALKMLDPNREMAAQTPTLA